MLSYLLTVCAAPVIINLTGTWTDLDNKVIKRAKYVCATEYRGCLKKFIKKEEQVYNAICGGKDE